MKQKALVVLVNLMNGDLDVARLNDALSDGWQFSASAESSSGSILVILQKDE